VQGFQFLDNATNCSFPNYCRDGNKSECTPTTPASPSTLAAWLDVHAGPSSLDALCHLPVCHFGIAVTTRDNLLAHPISTYRSINASFSSLPAPGEEDFFMEWAMSAVYGALSAGGEKCADGPPYPPRCFLPARATSG